MIGRLRYSAERQATWLHKLLAKYNMQARQLIYGRLVYYSTQCCVDASHLEERMTNNSTEKFVEVYSISRSMYQEVLEDY